MQLPRNPKKNYAMHVLASCLIELFPKLQLLDFSVCLDRTIIDFSFARELSNEELQLIKQRFLEKILNQDNCSVNEMMCSNAKDLLKHHKQFFLTDLIDPSAQLVEMLNIGLHHAPLIGEMEISEKDIKTISLQIQSFGEKKWMKRKIWHYQLHAYFFKNTSDEKKFFTKESSKERLDHIYIGKEQGLFAVDHAEKYFSVDGSKECSLLLSKMFKAFSEPVSFDGDIDQYFSLFPVELVTRVLEKEGGDPSVYYGLKSLMIETVVEHYSKEKKDFMGEVIAFLKTIGLVGVYYDQESCYVYDYLGRAVICAQIEQHKDFSKIDFFLEKIYALTLENRSE